MADNFSVKDGAAADLVLKSTDVGGVHTPHQIVEGGATEAKQDSAITALGLVSKESKQDSIITALGLLATLAKQDEMIAAIGNISGGGGGGSSTGGTLNQGQVTAGTTAVQFTATGIVPVGSVLVKSPWTSTETIYIGGVGVTATGFPVEPGESQRFEINNVNKLYAYAGADTVFHWSAISV